MTDTFKSPYLDLAVAVYVQEHLTGPDEVEQRLIDETAKMGDTAVLQLAPAQGAFLRLVTGLVGARTAVEIGTFTGYSSLCIARALPADGHLLCCDINEEWTAVARRYWAEAGVADRVELRLAPAVDTLRSIPEDIGWDLAFIDADKDAYPDYWQLVVPRLRPGGAIVVDNVLKRGRVADPAEADPDVELMRRFNDLVAADQRMESLIVPVGDGLTLARKRA